MKGVVFTEFLDMVEDSFGDEIVDTMIDNCDLASGGAYTAVGTYDVAEMIALVGELSQQSGDSVPDLLRVFGRHLFGRFSELYPWLFEGVHDPLEFIVNVEGYIHVEVSKLYPDAELPSFEHTTNESGEVELTYTSPRRLDTFAEGLILGAFDHFGHGQILESTPLGNGSRFRLGA
ncbi:MAG: hypothetical protein ACI841_004585 [Planctomycetota bacterium]|jgi:hypothetical protein